MLQLCTPLGVSVFWLENNLVETEILDYWFSYLETKGVDFKSNRTKALEAGFTDQDIANLDKEMEKYSK